MMVGGGGEMRRKELQSNRKEPRSKVTWAWGLAATGMAQRDKGGTEDRLGCRPSSCGGGFRASTGGHRLGGGVCVGHQGRILLSGSLPESAGRREGNRQTHGQQVCPGPSRQPASSAVFSNTVNKK